MWLLCEKADWYKTVVAWKNSFLFLPKVVKIIHENDLNFHTSENVSGTIVEHIQR